MQGDPFAVVEQGGYEREHQASRCRGIAVADHGSMHERVSLSFAFFFDWLMQRTQPRLVRAEMPVAGIRGKDRPVDLLVRGLMHRAETSGA